MIVSRGRVLTWTYPTILPLSNMSLPSVVSRLAGGPLGLHELLLTAGFVAER